MGTEIVYTDFTYQMVFVTCSPRYWHKGKGDSVPVTSYDVITLADVDQ